MAIAILCVRQMKPGEVAEMCRDERGEEALAKVAAVLARESPDPEGVETLEVHIEISIKRLIVRTPAPTPTTGGET